MLEETSLQLTHTSNTDIRRGNMCTHHPSKETKVSLGPDRITQVNNAILFVFIPTVRARRRAAVMRRTLGLHSNRFVGISPYWLWRLRQRTRPQVVTQVSTDTAITLTLTHSVHASKGSACMHVCLYA